MISISNKKKRKKKEEQHHKSKFKRNEGPYNFLYISEYFSFNVYLPHAPDFVFTELDKERQNVRGGQLLP